MGSHVHVNDPVGGAGWVTQPRQTMCCASAACRQCSEFSLVLSPFPSEFVCQLNNLQVAPFQAAREAGSQVQGLIGGTGLGHGVEGVRRGGVGVVLTHVNSVFIC